MTSPPNSGRPSVVVHDFQAFECTGCGRCCKPWTVSVDAHQMAEIEASQAYRSRLRENYVPLVADGDSLAVLGDRGDDGCVFLDERSLCSLHSELGIRKKPLGCQLYPYQPVQTPDGIFVSLSFACPPVVAGLDTDVEANRQDLAAALAFRPSHARNTEEAPFQVRLTGDHTISWSSYLRLESAILTAFDPNHPTDSALRITLAILRASQDSHALGSGLWPDLATREDLEFPKELLRKYLGSLVASVENFVDVEERYALADTVEAGQPIYSPRFDLHLAPLNPDQPMEPWILQTAGRYFRNAVAGKAMLKGSVIAKLLGLACAPILACYYAEGYRQARGEANITLEALTDAYRIVEYHIVTHTSVTDPYFEGLETTFGKLAALPLEEVP